MMASPISERNARARRESGYSFLMVVFMVATMLILAATAVPNILTQGRREREIETIWRGQQYERAIGLYFQKFGRYPTKIDDLVKQTNGVRFLRQAYTDPMNKMDGSWRFIYVGPNGQLIGSVRATSLTQSLLTNMATSSAGTPGAGTPTSPSTGTNNAPGGNTGAFSLGPSPGAQPTSGGSFSSALDSQPQPLGGAVIGGNIIGVGSKVKEPSLLVYQGGETYEEWEFIWNPVQMGVPGQLAGQQGGAVQQNSAGAPAGTGQAQPTPNPQAPAGPTAPQN